MGTPGGHRIHQYRVIPPKLCLQILNLQVFQNKMTPRAEIHDRCRTKVCGVCFRKPKQFNKISEYTLNLIRKYVYEAYSLDDQSLPIIICTSCTKTLTVIDSGESDRKLPDIDYGSLTKPPRVDTRSGDNEKCDCSVCTIARMNGPEYVKHEKSMRNKPGRPPLKVQASSVTIKQCSNCHSEIGPGKSHECTRSVTQENLVELVRSHSEKTQEQVTVKMLDAIWEKKGLSKQGGSTFLATKGNPKLVKIGNDKTIKPVPKYSIEDLTKLQVSRNLSDNDTLAVARFLRTKGGRNSVEANLSEGLKGRNHKLEDMFYMKEMTMKQKPRKKKKNEESESDSDIEDQEGLIDGMREVQRPGIFVKDIDEFTAFLVNERNLDPSAHIVQIGFDDGQGMLKVMLIVKDKEPELEEEKKRSKYSDGVCPKSSKLSSVKKMFVIGLVPDVQELYPNIRSMMDELKLGAIEYGFCADIKIYLSLIGKQVASCTHPCPYCEGKSPWDKKEKHLTIGSLNEWYQNFLDSGKDVKKAKKYQNVINPPLLTGDNNTKTLDVLNISELHCLTGSTGKIVSGLESAFKTKDLGERFINDFLKREDITKCVYQGSNSFEGNQARKLLKCVDKLERDVKILLDFETAAKTLPFVQALRLLDRVVTSCFGQDLACEYEDCIKAFSHQYRTLGISVTPKIHIIEQHIVEFLKAKGEVAGLGFWSEQAMESGHHDFKLEWEKVKVSSNHKQYSQRLYNTTVRYAGKHL